MNKIAGYLVPFLVVLTLAKPSPSRAQDFFRDLGTSRSSGGIGPVTPSDYTYDDASPSGLKPLRPGQDLSVVEETEETDKYNFALGSFRFSIAAGVGIEFNDNVNLSQIDRESDIIIRPVLNIDSEWRLSDLNTLHFNIGLSYAKYLDHPDLDTHGVLISPNSELELTFYTGAIKWSVRDRVGYQEDTYDVPDISNQAVYRRWENQAGLAGDWAINQTLSVAGVELRHYNLWAMQSADSDPSFDLQSRSIDTIFIKPSVQINPAVKVGVNASYSFIHFPDSDRSKGENVLAGPFIERQNVRIHPTPLPRGRVSEFDLRPRQQLRQRGHRPVGPQRVGCRRRAGGTAGQRGFTQLLRQI